MVGGGKIFGGSILPACLNGAANAELPSEHTVCCPIISVRSLFWNPTGRRRAGNTFKKKRKRHCRIEKKKDPPQKFTAGGKTKSNTLSAISNGIGRPTLVLLRGREDAQAETSLWATCFNIARMITLSGIGGLIDRLSESGMVPVCG